MLFKEVRPGNLIYILDKRNVNITKGTISSVSPPHVSTQPGVIGMFIDLSVSTDSGSSTYVVNDNGVTAYADNNNVVITTDVNNILVELRALKSRSEDILKDIDKYKENIERCNKYIADLDPVFKREQAYEQRFTKLENAFSEQAQTNKDIKELLTKLLKK